MNGPLAHFADEDTQAQAGRAAQPQSGARDRGRRGGWPACWAGAAGRVVGLAGTAPRGAVLLGGRRRRTGRVRARERRAAGGAGGSRAGPRADGQEGWAPHAVSAVDAGAGRRARDGPVGAGSGGARGPGARGPQVSRARRLLRGAWGGGAWWASHKPRGRGEGWGAGRDGAELGGARCPSRGLGLQPPRCPHLLPHPVGHEKQGVHGKRLGTWALGHQEVY